MSGFISKCVKQVEITNYPFGDQLLAKPLHSFEGRHFLRVLRREDVGNHVFSQQSTSHSNICRTASVGNCFAEALNDPSGLIISCIEFF